MTQSHSHSRRRRSSSDSNVGMQRFNLYKPAFSRISKALEGGFYIDAICILESLITDRLESYFLSVHDKDLSFSSLGTLIENFRSNKIQIDKDLRLLITERLHQWREERNTAAHAMVKLGDGALLPWEERVALCEKAAKEGLVLFREIDAHVRCAKRAQQS